MKGYRYFLAVLLAVFILWVDMTTGVDSSIVFLALIWIRLHESDAITIKIGGDNEK